MKEFDAVHACFWEDMVKYDTHSPFIPPDAHTTENVWTVRLTEGGFDHQQCKRLTLVGCAQADNE